MVTTKLEQESGAAVGNIKAQACHLYQAAGVLPLPPCFQCTAHLSTAASPRLAVATAQAMDSLASFYEACAQIEIDEYRDYEKALQVSGATAYVSYVWPLIQVLLPPSVEPNLRLVSMCGIAFPLIFDPSLCPHCDVSPDNANLSAQAKFCVCYVLGCLPPHQGPLDTWAFCLLDLGDNCAALTLVLP